MRKRAALIHYFKRFKEKYPLQFSEVDIESVELYIDIENSASTRPIIIANKNKFILICLELLKGRYNDTLYRVESDNITAMKLRSGQNNSRIYCQENQFRENVKKKVVMAKGLLNKTSQKNDKEILSIIESIKNYDYEFFKDTKKAETHRRSRK